MQEFFKIIRLYAAIQVAICPYHIVSMNKIYANNSY